MSEERMFKKVYKWDPMLTRPLGRPKNRWECDIRKDIKKLKIKNENFKDGHRRGAFELIVM